MFKVRKLIIKALSALMIVACISFNTGVSVHAATTWTKVEKYGETFYYCGTITHVYDNNSSSRYEYWKCNNNGCKNGYYRYSWWCTPAQWQSKTTCNHIISNPSVYATSVEISDTELELFPESNQVLTATVYPANATFQNVIWSSSDSSVATVDSSGKVTAVDKGGPVTITATSLDGSATATCTVNVKYPDMVVSSTNGSATYNGEPTNGGASLTVIQPSSGYTIKYGIELGNYDLDDIPTYTNAGVYTVYYKVTADYYNDYTGSFTITINKADNTLIAPTAKTLAYTGGEQELVNPGSSTAGTIKYKLGANGTYRTAVPTAKEVGDYIVYYKVEGGNNHIDVAEDSVYTEIKKYFISLPSTEEILESSSVTLTPTMLSTVNGAIFTWTSSDTNVATVDQNGKVEAKSSGTATITATADNGETATCLVTVYRKITFHANGGSGTQEDVKVYANSGTYTLPTKTTITPPKGKSFAGWSTTKKW